MTFDERAWGWGAATVGDAPKGWVCPFHGKKAKSDDGIHTYRDGTVRCTACARAFWEATDAGLEPPLPHDAEQLFADGGVADLVGGE